MAEFFVFTCRMCHGAYNGALEVTERATGLSDRTGLCPDCFEQLVGPWSSVDVDTEVESREDGSGSAPAF